MGSSDSRRWAGRKAPPEVTGVMGGSAALLAIVASGSGIAALLPDPNAWQFAAAYLAPASVAFLIYWWVAQRL